MGFRPDLEIFLPIRVIHPSAVTPDLLASIPPALSGDSVSSPPIPTPSPPLQHPEEYQYSNIPPENVHGALIDPMHYHSSSPTPWEIQMQPIQQGPPPHSPWPHSPQHQFFFDDAVPQIGYQDAYLSSYVSGLISPPLPPPPRPLSADPYYSATSGYPAITHPQPPSDPVSMDQNHFTGLPVFEPRAVPPDNPLAEDRASRISRHLRRTSRHRSLSPHGRPSLLRLDTLPPPVMEYTNISPHQQDDVLENNQSPPVLSPRPIPSPQRSYFDEQEGMDLRAGNSGQSPRVQELERIVSSYEGQSAETSGMLVSSPKEETPFVVPPPRIDKTLPRAPSPPALPSTSTNKTTDPLKNQARVVEEQHALPAAAFGDFSTIATSAALSSAVSDNPHYSPLLEFDSSPTTIRADAAAAQPSGLTLLERRLRLPAAYEIFDQGREDTPSRSNETLSSTAVESVYPKPVEEKTPVPAELATQLGPSDRTARRKRFSNGNGRKLAAVEEEKNARVSAWVYQEAQKPLEVLKPASPTTDQQTLPEEEMSPALKAPASVAISHGVSKLDWTTLKRVGLDIKCLSYG